MATKGKNNRTKKTNNSTKKSGSSSKSSTKSTSKSKNTTKSRSSSSTKTKSSSMSRKPKEEYYEEEEFRDPFFEDSSKEIVLWIAIGVGILLLISNIGIGGTVGNAVADTLFGIFGIIQYILPLAAAFCVFFIISNYGNKVAIAKVICGGGLAVFISAFIELFINGNEQLGALGAYDYGRENHAGGGLIGGAISDGLVTSFGIVGAYIIDIIAIAVCIIIIVEHFAFDKVRSSSVRRADRAAARRRLKREQMQLEREASQVQYNAERRARLDRLEEERRMAEEQEANTTGPRSSRKRTGITSDTLISPSYDDVAVAESDGVSEIRYNGAEESVEVTETSRHQLFSNKRGSHSSTTFKDTPTVEQEAAKPVEEPVKAASTGYESQFSAEFTDMDYKPPVINTPKYEPAPAKPEIIMPEIPKQEPVHSEPIKIEPEPIKPRPEPVNTAPPVEPDMAAEPEQPKEQTASRKPRASVTNQKEMEASAKDMQESIDKQEEKPKKPYQFPSLDLLNNPKSGTGDSKEYLSEMANKLQRTLSNFGVSAQVTEVTLGPSVTRYEISIAEGTKVSKVVNLSDDIKLNMAVTDVRIEAPIPGKSAIGIEVPNKEKVMVGFKELVSSKEFTTAKSKISFCVGKDISGQVIVGNIEKMPHLLIAGATGSGKSVCINTIIMSILYHATPDEVKLIMVDPKMVELSVYNGIPHLLIPVVTDAKKAAGALHWAVKEMTDRYELLAMAGVRNLEGYNEKAASDALPENIPASRRNKLPQIIVVLDELADLMMVAAADVEDSIVRLAQLARAAGIHLIIATQRPTANVITGLIKANVPSRIAFSVSSSVDSRVILDMTGAEDLLGNGDMLYSPQNLSKPIRVQGAFVDDDEVSRVVNFIKENNDISEENKEIAEQMQKAESASGSVQISGEPDNSQDQLFAEAGRLVIENQKGSIGYLQRNFRIGFNRAARIMDQLAEAGVVGPEMGTKPREIKMSISQFEELLNQQ